MTEQWPPDWDDPEPDDGHQDVELPELSAFLASVPGPALPTSFEARISAAIAAEAAARAAAVPGPAVEPAAEPDQAPQSAPVRDGLGAHPVTADHGRPRRRRPRMPSAQAASWILVACLILGGFGFLVTRGSGSSSSSEAASSPSAQGAAAPAAGSEASAPRDSQAQGDHPAADEPSAGAAAGSGSFLVYSTGTAYRQSTLAAQIQGQLLVYGAETKTGGAGGGTAPVPSDSVSASAATSSVPGAKPSSQLTGCVSAVTEGLTPTLVDKASYDGTPAYIIATPAEAWVVGLGCTADDTDLIARVALKG